MARQRIPEVKPGEIAQPLGRSLPRVSTYMTRFPPSQIFPPYVRTPIRGNPPLTAPASFSHDSGSSHICSHFRPFPSATLEVRRALSYPFLTQPVLHSAHLMQPPALWSWSVTML